MKQRIAGVLLGLCLIASPKTWAYSGELWLTQANKPFGEPASMLAHGFLAGVVHSWNDRRDSNFPKLCFNAPPEELQIRNLRGIVKDYISAENPDLQAPAQGIIRVAMMARFPCR